MPKTIYIAQDQIVQYSNKTNDFYDINKLYKTPSDKGLEKAEYKTYKHTLKEQKEAVILQSTKLESCHTIFLKDKTNNKFYALHTSPQSLRKFYNPKTKSSVLNSAQKSFGSFDFFQMDNAMIDACPPAYAGLDAIFHPNKNIGINKGDELDVAIIVNNQYWNKESAKTKILKTLQQRIPGIIKNSNIIVSNILDKADCYDVTLDTQSEKLMVIANHGLYTENYDKPFTDSSPCNPLTSGFSKEKQNELNLEIKRLAGHYEGFSDFAHTKLRTSTQDNNIENSIVKLHKHLNDEEVKELKKYIKEIQNTLNKTSNIEIDIKPHNYFKISAALADLYLAIGDFENCKKYSSIVARFAESIHRNEYDYYESNYAKIAAVASLMTQDLETAYHFLGQPSRHAGRQYDSLLRLADLAAKLGKKELILENLHKADRFLPSSKSELEKVGEFGPEYSEEEKKYFDIIKNRLKEVESGKPYTPIFQYEENLISPKLKTQQATALSLKP